VVTEPEVRYRVGQLVEVRSAEEIMATLDQNGELDALPFMPEMLQYCGKQLRVGKVANKVCDTMTRSGMRKMEDAVHLMGVRCDGSQHSGCQAACLIYWKNAWIRPVEGSADVAVPADPEAERKVFFELSTLSRRTNDEGEDVYRCQATEILRAAPRVLPLREVDQYVVDLRSGNVGFWSFLRALLVGAFNRYQVASSNVLPKWLRFRGGLTWGFLRGGVDGKTPTGQLDLKVGELVRVKSKEEILKTLNSDLLNRGLGFDVEMSRFCGKTARVLRRIDTIVDEKTGKMLYMKNPCIVLDGVVCEGVFSANCPRAITAYWREIWLERVETPA
jgi:hypothetical protein